MPFGPHIVALVEDALSECFQYHSQLDAFLDRVGLSRDRLAAARGRAEARKGKWDAAPKRYVSQEVLAELNSGSSADDRLMAVLIDGLCRGTFNGATAKALEAIEGLKRERELGAKTAADRRAEDERKRAEAQRTKDARLAQQRLDREQFHQEFFALLREGNAQQRGYRLETFLNGFLAHEGLAPRGSFRIEGEQIDGSFSTAGKTWLLEAKWVTAPVSGAEFGAFEWKLQGKTADTRGLFVSINGFSQEAIQALNHKGTLRFACLDGAHLLRATEANWTLERILNIVWRHASETGEAYLPVGSQRFQHWANA